MKVQLRVTNWVGLSVPGGSQREAFCYVAIPDIPHGIVSAGFTQVNPRRPVIRSDGRVASGKGPEIIATLFDAPEKMQDVSRGIRILVHKFKEIRNSGGRKTLELELTDPSSHGIVDGLHTYMSCLYAIEQSNGSVESLRSGKVLVTLRQGTASDAVPEIAEGLNSSMQVDQRSIDNLREVFDVIKVAFDGHRGADHIAYKQGDSGENVRSTVALMHLMDIQSFDGKRNGNISGHPVGIYRQAEKALALFKKRLDESTEFQDMVKHLPEICELRDRIVLDTPRIYNSSGGRFGGLSVAKKFKKPVRLPFIPQSAQYSVPSGWYIPILAAFRANVRMNRGKFQWIIPLDKLYDAVIGELVGEVTQQFGDSPSECGRNVGIFVATFKTVKAAVADLR